MENELDEKKREEMVAAIMTGIRHEKNKYDRRRAVFFGATFVLSAVAAVPAFAWLMASLSSSGFMTYASLAFSDFGRVSVYWDSFAMTLLEALPAMSLTVCVIVLLAMAESLRRLAAEIGFSRLKFKLN